MKQALELNPLGGIDNACLGDVYLEQGRFPEALAAFEKEPDEGFRLLGLAAAYHALGRNAQSSAALEQLGEVPDARLPERSGECLLAATSTWRSNGWSARTGNVTRA